MKRENVRRLLDLSRECQMEGWVALSAADSLLMLSREGVGGVEVQAGKLIAESAGHFRDVERLLEQAGEGLSEL